MSERFDRLLLRASQQARSAGGGEAGWGRKAQLVLDLLLPMQRAVVLSQAKRIAARTSRRAGKTTTVRGRLAYRCLSKKNAKCLYIALTRQSAENLMWTGKTGLKRFAHELGLGQEVEFNNSKLQMTFGDRGSVLQLSGADNRADIDKWRGDEFDEVWIDECKSFPAALLAELITQVIEPSLITRDGTLGLIGTPGNLLTGLFYDVTRTGSAIARPHDEPQFDDERVWSFHTWAMRDNTAEPEQWARALKIKSANKWSDNNPIWLREYLGQWAADETDHVYRFRPHTDDGLPWNTWTPGPRTQANPFGLPLEHKWQFTIGMDLGHADPFALEVLAFSDTCRQVLQVYEFSKPKMSVTDVGNLLVEVIGKLGGYPTGIVADTAGLGGMLIQEIAERFGIRVEAAEKKNKNDAVELMNADLIDGHMKLLDEPGKENVLRTQMLELQWDETGLKENKAQRNDCCDAAIYARRKALHHFSHDGEAPRPKAGTPEAQELEAYEAELRAANPRSEAEYLDELQRDNNDEFAERFRGEGGDL